MKDAIRQRSRYGELVGSNVLNVDPERRTLEVEYAVHEGFTNPIGTIAGAMIAGLLDSVTGLVANAHLPDDRVAVHRTLSVEYLRRGIPGRWTGRGEVLEETGREIRSRGTLFDEDGQRVATGVATLRSIAWPED